MFSDDAARGYPCVCVLGEERFKRVCVCVFEHEPVHALFRSDTRIPPQALGLKWTWNQTGYYGSKIFAKARAYWASQTTQKGRGVVCVFGKLPYPS